MTNDQLTAATSNNGAQAGGPPPSPALLAKAPPMQLPELLSPQDISGLLGVSLRHCVDRIVKRPDFPKPALDLSTRGRRWRRADVLRWAGLK